MEEGKTNSLAAAFGCQVGEMSFTYLGLPLGITRPTLDEYMPLLNRIERRMMGLNKMLTYSGRLILVNSVLSALPTFYLCTLRIPVTVWDQIDKYRKHHLWDNGDLSRKEVAWWLGNCL